MTELEQLKAQRRELDRRIRELTNPRYDTDDASMYLRHYPAKDDAWLIVLEEIDGAEGKHSARKQIVSAKTKGEAIELLQYQICALVELYNKATGKFLTLNVKGEE